MMGKPASEETKQHWKTLILKQRASGLSVAKWCKDNLIAEHIFHYREKQLFQKENLNRSDFTEINEVKSVSKTKIILEYREFKIDLDAQFDPDALMNCLKMLKQC